LCERHLELDVFAGDLHPDPVEIAGQNSWRGVLERDAVARRLADGVDHLGRVEPGLGAQGQRLGDQDPIDLHQHVVDQLHRDTLAERTEVSDLRGHGLKNRPHAFERSGIAADVSSQCAGLGAYLHAGDRRVEEVDAPLGKLRL
jgi:hypothetical protein